MKTAYFDCIAGASGDMLLGALIDAGLPAESLEAELAKLHLDDFRLEVKRVSKNGFGATKVDVHVRDDAPERHLRHILAVLDQSDVVEAVKKRAARVFTRICEAEAKIHGRTVEQVHLHEVGGVDAIVDVVGTLAGAAVLGLERVVVSPVPLGRGFVDGAHGRIPLPAPATVALLEGAPVRPSEVDAETVTPTGAALLAELADAWGPVPEMTLQATGYGAGTRDMAIPNLLRLMVGETATGEAAGWTTETITVLETNLDDETGETIGHTARRLMAEGALDVIVVPAQMKKDRPASLVKVLARPEDTDRLERIIFEETATLGVRRTEVRRDALPRRSVQVNTRFGSISVKIADLPGGGTRAVPEYEDCRCVAEANRVSLREVREAAIMEAESESIVV
jgi:uncharacterized protein (TIGR00299 family) protein